MRLLLAIIALLGCTTADVHQIPLVKVESLRTKMMREGSWARYVQMKNTARFAKEMISNNVFNSQRVSDFEDEEYIGNITIGTPEQVFRYGTGTASGYLGRDIIRFGSPGTKQLVVPNTVFGQANNLSPFFAGTPIDGILGLAFKSIAVDDVTPPFQNAIELGLVDQPLFTVFLKHVGGEVNVNGGVYTYGGIDNTNCGPIIDYQPLSSASYWQFTMNGVKAGGYNAHMNWQVISDTGTSLIAAPTAVAQLISRSARGMYDSQTGMYFIECDAKPTVELTIGKHNYAIEAKNLVLPAGDGRCLLSIFGQSGYGFGPSWILGDPFIRQFCNVYDVGQKRIGFAKSLQH